MSQDIQLTHRCPHVTLEDRVFLGVDRQTLSMSQPVDSTSVVRLVANDEVIIPSTGYHSRAKLTSGQSGPFRILANENDLIVSSSTEQVTFSLPVGSRVPASDIARQIRQGMSSVVVEDPSTVNGHLQLTDFSSMGTRSRLRLEGKAAALLGFDRTRGAKGKQVFPPWRLVPQAGSTDRRDLTIQFTSRVKSNPIFKASYVVRSSRCQRCQSSQIENDYRFDNTGSVILIENENLLYQECLKIILTDRGSNPYHTFYGTSITRQIGTKAVASAAALISEDIRRALNNLQAMQEVQGQAQFVSRRERLYRIVTVETSSDEFNPTIFRVNVVVANAARRLVPINITFTIPDVIALDATGDLVVNPNSAGLTADERQQVFGR